MASRAVRKCTAITLATRGSAGCIRLSAVFLIPIICSVGHADRGFASQISRQIEVHSEVDIQIAVTSSDAVVVLPPRAIVITRPIIVRENGARSIVGQPGSTLVTSPEFKGSAIIHLLRVNGMQIEGFEIRGTRHPTQTVEMPDHDVAFLRHFDLNGVVVEASASVTLRRIDFREIQGFAVLANSGRNLIVHRIRVTDSGSLNSRGRNNTSGGILFEDGVTDFTVSECELKRILGNGVWTHSRNGFPRSLRGHIEGNLVEDTSRDAFQAGHASQITFSNNRGRRIGYPPSRVDIENLAVPVAIDTAGNVDNSHYHGNVFRDVNGTCINLDGFHDGTVKKNHCTNLEALEYYPHSHFGIAVDNSNPEMESRNIQIVENTIIGTAYGGLYLFGRNHTIAGNVFRNINRARCTGVAGDSRCNYQLTNPGLLRSGIFLAGGGNRKDPAAQNTIIKNELSGFRMRDWCIGAASEVIVGDNLISGNTCSNGN